MKIVLKLFKWVGLLLLLFVAGLTATVLARRNRTFEAPFPDLHASSDPAVIERGRYLVNGPGHCVECHAANDLILERQRSHEPFADDTPLVGGYVIDIPPGKFYARNLTPDDETGIGKKSDGEVARVMRYAVRPDGQCMLPVMPFQNLSDEDLTALISYLRSRPKVSHFVPDRHWTVLGEVVRALVLKPEGPAGTPPKHVEEAATAEYGKYLAHGVANCYGCHTDRSLRTGEFIGEPFAGGFQMESPLDPNTIAVSQNLTPDPTTGKITSWTEEVFVARFRTKSTADGSLMPWAAFSRMKDDDLRALYRYLRTVKPVAKDCGAPIRKKTG